mmetsp:Transcript_23969/g.62515  ORF Transcript_23969/g.62515 Transcript_23969/m.62515 type:complete len:94 (-) Transcript_23969:77-358(-)
MRMGADALYSCDFPDVATRRRHGNVGGHVAVWNAAAACGCGCLISRGALGLHVALCSRRRFGAVDVLRLLSALDAPLSTARGPKAGRGPAEGF